MEFIRLKSGFRTALADGLLVSDSPKHMATEELYRAVPGSLLRLCDKRYVYAVARYSPERNLTYAYTYAYHPDENWTSYTKNLTPESYGTEDYRFDRECWFRVCVKRADGGDIEEEDRERAGELVCFSGEKPAYQEKECFGTEAARVAKAIQEAEKRIQTKGQTGRAVMKLCLLADTHYTVGGTWEDTAHNIWSVAEKAGYDAIVHLGDLTDGMLSKERTERYVRRIVNDLEKCRVPLYIVPGNHDSNYFRNRANTFTGEEMKRLYRLGRRGAVSEKEYMEKPESAEDFDTGLDYYIDIPDYSVRMVFLSSFEDTAAIRYGYREEQLVWLRETLALAKSGTRFLIFSHDAPVAKLDYWSFHIRNGERLLDILEDYNHREDYRVIGFFYGHTHADYVFEECSFPLISIGCAKLEYFTDKKPQGAMAWPREAGTVTQDLWDSLLIDFDKEKLFLIRFGAGEDREVSFARRDVRYRDVLIRRRQERSMKIWAHRGASGHAPENTLAAFELAEELGADGIELDVQLTRDGIPVVIHDERVDRVADGTGLVRDFTLQELRGLNVNKNFPAYGRTEIPTLSEVYDWIKHTDLTVNLELKNGQIDYEGLEEKVLRLAEEKGIADQILYSSFNHRSMLRLKRLWPAARIAFLYSDGFLDMAAYGVRYGAWALHPSLANILSDKPAAGRDGRSEGNASGSSAFPSSASRLIEECHQKGLRVHVWTVNEKTDMQRLKEWGADAVITNFVEKG